MKYLSTLFVILVFFSCVKSKDKHNEVAITQVKEKTLQDNSKIDAVKYSKSKAIIKGKLIECGSGNKYLYPTIQVMDILMNTSGLHIKDTIKVAHYNWKSGIPKDKECIIYLTSWPIDSENFNKNESWMLIEGDGKYACECK
ncbi:hypothetical protein [Psychroserpens sp. NJDZ02]|uniref:hypothetical protein n=1 Tax=Psychroserpens sp. NJDZ02 TaxID=2570561 RepID=UPI0010A8549A|nr:hypothetical protein [Psychroserpens sp. NJDZ02]QCE40148.1 hypothetical protein E9099_01490 [Psychroserpens sp. NJDZ02]